MLVLVSDLHLTGGSSGTTINADAFRILRNQLRTLAYAASWRKDGTYKPIEGLDLVLLGDVLDVIRSWQYSDIPGAIMPWSDAKTVEFAARVADRTKAIIANNGESLNVLKSMSVDGALTIPADPVPPSDAKSLAEGGEPEGTARRRLPVKVSTYYQVGNHDWFYHLPGPAFDQIRNEVVAAIGLANDPSQPFPHDPSEPTPLKAVYDRHRVLARHGDIYDPFNCERSRDGSSLGDVIVVKLLNRFPAEVRDRLGSVLPAECLDGLNEIDNVRPLLMVPVWINGLLNRTCSSGNQIAAVKKVWDELVDDFLRTPFVQKRDSFWDWFDSVDKLEWALKFSKGVGIATLGEIVELAKKVGFGKEEEFFRNALKEAAFQNRTADFIVYGHTHHFEIVPLDVSSRTAGLLNQLCINTGTWRRVYEVAECKPKEQEFIGYDVMTYVAFYADGERTGRPFETWSGSLGLRVP